MKHSILTWVILFVPFALGAQSILLDSAISYSTHYSPTAVGAGNFNADSRTDLAVGALYVKKDTGAIEIFIQKANNTLSQKATLFFAAENPAVKCLIVGDLNSDGFDDIAFGYDHHIGIFYQRSPGQADSLRTITLNEQVSSLKMGYFNSDTLVDLVISHPDQGKFSILYQPTAEQWDHEEVTTFSSRFSEVDVGDLNNDGKEDIVLLAGRFVDTVGLFVHYQDKNGIDPTPTVLRPKQDMMDDFYPGGIAVEDVNGEIWCDLKDIAFPHAWNRCGCFWVCGLVMAAVLNKTP